MSNSLFSGDVADLELLEQHPFTAGDFEILKSYEAVVDGLAMLIGSHCEIVLHSLEDLKCSAVRIANGEHTGRKIGSPITDLALRMLHDMTGADSNVSKAYFTRAKSGVLMKSVTIAIRNREQRVIGLLCINMNLDVPFSQIMTTFMPPETQEVASSVNFASSVEDLVMQTLEFSTPARPTGRTIFQALADLRLIPAHDGNPATIPKPAGVQARLLDLLGIDISRPRWLTQ